MVKIDLDNPTSASSDLARALVLEHILPESLPKSLMATLITSEQVNLKMRFKGSREVEGGSEKIIIRLEKVGESKSPLFHGCGRKLWEKYAT